MRSPDLVNAGRAERLTRAGWFYVVFILLGTMVPPIVSRGTVRPAEIGEVITYILSHALVNQLTAAYPIFKVIPLLLLAGLFRYGTRMSRWLSLYAGLSYVLFAFLQGIAITDKYGFAMVTGNVIMILVVAGFWFWEAGAGANDFSPRRIPAGRYWVVPLAFLAFWAPVDLSTARPDLNPLYLVANPAGLAFCWMTPVYLAILTLYYPTVNLPVLRVTSLAGILIGFWNLVTDFVMQPARLWWMGVLHLPLVLISIYGFALSLRKLRRPLTPTNAGDAH